MWFNREVHSGYLSWGRAQSCGLNVEGKALKNKTSLFFKSAIFYHIR